MPGTSSATSGDLLVVGHTVIDRYWHVPSLPVRDRTVPVDQVRVVLGGTAANIARAAAARGIRTGLVSRVGDEFPKEFRSELARAGIDLRGLETVRGSASPTCLIVEDGRGGQMTLIDQGPMGDESSAVLPVRLLPSYPWVHLTTGDPAFQLRVLRAARAVGARVAADPAQEIHYRWKSGPLRQFLTGSEIFFGNESETAAAVRLTRSGRVGNLTRLVPLVVVTRGRRGARAYSRSGTTDVPGRLPRPLRQVTGAGDSFRGGFYGAWLRGAPLADALSDGVAAATAWIETAEYPKGRRR
ncbi:MAG: PfkB family carbohydrate kinase [Thermoplasmata archaeon]|nr:PfkB family carbohydrate kinase [Thermoplasmata archaeon]MCI4361857.1 PfkB family carbohydrate kinase [Thermoplasmata archaeon]